MKIGTGELAMSPIRMCGYCLNRYLKFIVPHFNSVIYYTRRDSNPQPMVPKTIALFS